LFAGVDADGAVFGDLDGEPGEGACRGAVKGFAVEVEFAAVDGAADDAVFELQERERRPQSPFCKVF